MRVVTEIGNFTSETVIHDLYVRDFYKITVGNIDRNTFTFSLKAKGKLFFVISIDINVFTCIICEFDIYNYKNIR